MRALAFTLLLTACSESTPAEPEARPASPAAPEPTPAQPEPPPSQPPAAPNTEVYTSIDEYCRAKLAGLQPGACNSPNDDAEVPCTCAALGEGGVTNQAVTGSTSLGSPSGAFLAAKVVFRNESASDMQWCELAVQTSRGWFVSRMSDCAEPLMAHDYGLEVAIESIAVIDGALEARFARTETRSPGPPGSGEGGSIETQRYAVRCTATDEVVQCAEREAVGEPQREETPPAE